MDADRQAYSSDVPFSVVKHIDRVIEKCVSQWRMETLPQHQNFGLAEGYTEVIVADTFETILGKTLQEINDTDEAADSPNVISIAVFAPINSDKKQRNGFSARQTVFYQNLRLQKQFHQKTSSEAVLYLQPAA